MSISMSLHELNVIDPLKMQPVHGFEGAHLSPMNPPPAFAPIRVEQVGAAEMHPVLQMFMEEHLRFLEELKAFEDAILGIQKTGFTPEGNKKIRDFFQFFDQHIVTHARQEEDSFFPLLKKRLIESGEHSKEENPTTPVDLMEDDHIKAIQLAAVVLNFLGLAVRLPDERSRLMVLDAALEQGKNLVECLRLHIFREDHVLFGAAHRLITRSEFDQML